MASCSDLIEVLNKYSADAATYTVDLSLFFEIINGETITAIATPVLEGDDALLTIAPPINLSTYFTMFLSGGTSGVTYSIFTLITFSGGNSRTAKVTLNIL